MKEVFFNNLCIIPARGQSKRIPRKNIRNFNGKPIIAYAIETAISSGLFDSIIVSTDDDEIMEVALKFGASIPFKRSEKNSSDFSTTADVIVEVLDEFSSKGIFFMNTCVIYPCTPLLRNEHLKNGYNELIEESFDTVFTVVKYNPPIQRALIIEDKYVKMVNPEYELKRTQDLAPTYFDGGQFYWFKTSTILANKKMYNDNMGCIILNESEIQDIDIEEDWIVAEEKYAKLK